MNYQFLATVVAASAFAGLAVAPAQAATTVDFEQGTNAASYTSQGIVLSNIAISDNDFGGTLITSSAPTYAQVLEGGTISFVDTVTGLATTVNNVAFTVLGLRAGAGRYNGGTATFFGTGGNVIGMQSFAPVGPLEGRTPIIYNNLFNSIALVSFSLIPNVNGAGIFGIDDLSFTANVSAVPEPTTWAMMIAGFGLVGVGLRTRKRNGVRITYA